MVEFCSVNYNVSTCVFIAAKSVRNRDSEKKPGDSVSSP